MSIEVIGAGWGRTGTNSLKIALERLGYGTCHHMWEVARDRQRLVPLWTDALDGRPDWPSLFAGNRSAVDWPVAAFWRELADHYPDAKVILTTRSAESWCESFSGTIARVLADPETMPEETRPGFRMARRAVLRSLGPDWSRPALLARFRAHEANVIQSVPPDRLLMFSPHQGWEPLCRFLDRPVPQDPFPRTNARDEFFARVDAIE
ncbi:MAG: sulfotransferase family protein [Rhodobacteraceae bacterium]|nr:MAG: sulfotransferase family protein [Paracoccaceae bacterium]